MKISIKIEFSDGRVAGSKKPHEIDERLLDAVNDKAQFIAFELRPFIEAVFQLSEEGQG